MNHEFWDNLLLIRKAYARTLERVCRDWGLTRAEMDVLLFLANNPERDRASDIVELRGLTKSHVSVAVKGLHDRGLLEATQDAADHRVIHLVPTAAAREMIRAGQESQRQQFSVLLDDFTPAELEEFRRLQKKLLVNLKKLEEEA